MPADKTIHKLQKMKQKKGKHMKQELDLTLNSTPRPLSVQVH